MPVYGVFLFLWQCVPRREGNRELTQPSVVAALRAAFPQLDTIQIGGFGLVH